MSTPITAPRLATAIDVEDSVAAASAIYGVQNADRMSIQVNAVDSTPAEEAFVAADVDPSTFATGTVTVVDYTDLAGATLTVNGTALVEGVDWTAAVDNDTTAASLELAIEAVTNINSSATGAAITVTYAVAGTVGNAAGLVSSEPVSLTVSGATLTGGEDLSYITLTAHSFVTGLAVALTGTNLPAGLSATDYWVIVVDEDTIRLASSLSNANAGTFVIITTAGTTADAELTPAALGSSTVVVEASLDGENFFAYATPKTVTITTTGNQFLDCGQLTVPYVRVRFVPPEEGSLTLTVLAWFQNTQVKLNS